LDLTTVEHLLTKRWWGSQDSSNFPGRYPQQVSTGFSTQNSGHRDDKTWPETAITGHGGPPWHQARSSAPPCCKGRAWAINVLSSKLNQQCNARGRRSLGQADMFGQHIDRAHLGDRGRMRFNLLDLARSYFCCLSILGYSHAARPVHDAP
jgi:hypothetical protein